MSTPRKLLFHFDTDAVPSVFDTVVAYDGGADHLQGYGGVTPETVGALVDGTIFTRGPQEKKYTAIFVGGGDMAKGEALLEAVKSRFFGKFRVSVMLDSNGSNTTAAAGVAYLAHKRSLQGKRAIVLAGTGPVGRRAAALLAQEGAIVSLTSRVQSRADDAARDIEKRFKVSVTPVQAFNNADRAEAVKGFNVVFAAGAIGIELLEAAAWQNEASIELLADVNAQPPYGIQGVEAMDNGKDRNGKTAYGALGIGGLKLRLHRQCIAQLFERDDQILDAEEIYQKAKALA